MKKFSNEVKTGLVIVMAILVAIFFWFKTSKGLISETYVLKTSFNRADGVKENAIVKLAGVEVGRVDDVKFTYKPDETRVELGLILDKKARVREDSIAYIGTTGFIGDAYIGITPGTAQNFLKKGETITSEDPVETREIMKRAEDISKNLDVILADAKTIVADNKDKVDIMVTNLEAITENFKEFSADIKEHPWKLLFKGKETKKGK